MRPGCRDHTNRAAATQHYPAGTTPRRARRPATAVQQSAKRAGSGCGTPWGRAGTPAYRLRAKIPPSRTRHDPRPGTQSLGSTGAYQSHWLPAQLPGAVGIRTGGRQA